MMKQNIKSKQRKVFFLLLPILVSVFAFLPSGCGIPNAAGTSKAAEKFLGEWQDETGSVILDVWKEDSGQRPFEIDKRTRRRNAQSRFQYSRNKPLHW